MEETRPRTIDRQVQCANHYTTAPPQAFGEVLIILSPPSPPPHFPQCLKLIGANLLQRNIKIKLVLKFPNKIKSKPLQTFYFKHFELTGFSTI